LRQRYRVFATVIAAFITGIAGLNNIPPRYPLPEKYFLYILQLFSGIKYSYIISQVFVILQNKNKV